MSISQEKLKEVEAKVLQALNVTHVDYPTSTTAGAVVGIVVGLLGGVEDDVPEEPAKAPVSKGQVTGIAKEAIAKNQPVKEEKKGIFSRLGKK